MAAPSEEKRVKFTAYHIFGKTPTQSVPRKDNNIEISIFNVVAQKVVLASDQCEIFTTL